MEGSQPTQLTAVELKEFFNRLFPNGFAGGDVVREIAPKQWENSPLLACFHPSPQQVFEERARRYRKRQELRGSRRENDPDELELAADPAPTMEEVLADWQDQRVNVIEEVTDLVGRCLWDVFSDNHEVIAADGRLVDIGSFRGASAFLDDYLVGPKGQWDCGDEHRFYMGSIWISRRADLTPAYKMIFRRLKALGADWKYHFPQLYLVNLSPLREATEKQAEPYSPSEAFAKEQEERERQAELQRAKAELEEIENQGRREAMDLPPPETVRAYQEIYGRDPRGWPP